MSAEKLTQQGGDMQIPMQISSLENERMWWKTGLKMLGKWALLGSPYQPAAGKISCVPYGWEDDPGKGSIREP